MKFPSGRWRVRLFILAILLSGFATFAQRSMTVAQLTAFIRSAIEQKNPDKDVAKTVSDSRLTERFTLADLQELQDAGVGPKTLTALAAMVTRSAALPPPRHMTAASTTTTSQAEKPADSEQIQVLEDTREWALDYVKSLPDFLCWEVTDRSVDQHFRPGQEPSWTHADRVIEKLTFFDHKENYELFMHNDTATLSKSADSLGGARSTGEWASLLGEIFNPATHTQFHWVAWKSVRTKPVYEFHYSVEQKYSGETVAHGDKEKIVTGFHGSVFIQKGANVVLRITVTPEIPPEFPVQDVQQIVDYEYQAIGDRQFLLPQKSTVQMRDGSIASLNDIRWQTYKKYSADTTLTFDDGDKPK